MNPILFFILIFFSLSCYSDESKIIYDEDEKLLVRLVDQPPPAGLSMSWGKQKNNENIFILLENNIKPVIYEYDGEEYVSWDLEDAEKVEGLLNIKPWKRDVLKKFREESKKK